MALTQRLVELGRSARPKAKVKTRQPLQRALISTECVRRTSSVRVCLTRSAAELNVDASRVVRVRRRSRRPQREGATSASSATASARRPHGRRGDRGGRRRRLSPGSLASARRGHRRRRRRVDRDRATRCHRRAPARGLVGGQRAWRDDRARPRADSRARARGPRPRRRCGSYRRRARTAGLDVSDRITLTWSADGELAAALREHSDLVGREMLAVDDRRRAERTGARRGSAGVFRRQPGPDVQPPEASRVRRERSASRSAAAGSSPSSSRSRRGVSPSADGVSGTFAVTLAVEGRSCAWK